jgi:hypothetical protein
VENYLINSKKDLDISTVSDQIEKMMIDSKFADKF